MLLTSINLIELNKDSTQELESMTHKIFKFYNNKFMSNTNDSINPQPKQWNLLNPP